VSGGERWDVCDLGCNYRSLWGYINIYIDCLQVDIRHIVSNHTSKVKSPSDE